MLELAQHEIRKDGSKMSWDEWGLLNVAVYPFALKGLLFFSSWAEQVTCNIKLLNDWRRLDNGLLWMRLWWRLLHLIWSYSQEIEQRGVRLAPEVFYEVNSHALQCPIQLRRQQWEVPLYHSYEFSHLVLDLFEHSVICMLLLVKSGSAKPQFDLNSLIPIRVRASHLWSDHLILEIEIDTFLLESRLDHPMLFSHNPSSVVGSCLKCLSYLLIEIHYWLKVNESLLVQCWCLFKSVIQCSTAIVRVLWC